MSIEQEAIDVLRAYGRALRAADNEAIRHGRIAVANVAIKLAPEVYTDPALARASEHLKQAVRHLARTEETTQHIPRARLP